MMSSDGWKAREEDLRRIAKRQRGFTVTYVQGPCGSGKSTTMLLELCEEFAKRHDGADLIYVSPGSGTPGEGTGHKAIAEQFLDAAKSAGNVFLQHAWQPNGPLILQSYSDFIFTWSEQERRGYELFSKPTAIFWDLEMLPSLTGEVAIAALLNAGVFAANKFQHRIAIFVLASHWSQRTADVFHKVLLTPVKHIKFDMKEAEVAWTRLAGGGDGSASWIPIRSLDEDSTQCVMRGGALNQYVPGLVAHKDYEEPPVCSMNVTTEWVGDSRTLKELQRHVSPCEFQFVTLSHAVTWSTSVRGLTRLYSPNKVGDVLLHQPTGQLVVQERRMTRAELNRLHSWAIKSAAEYGKPVEIVAPYRREDLDGFPDDTDSVGSAWTTDLVFTVLRIRELWDGYWLGDIPMRRPVDGEIWLYAETVLQCGGCLNDGGDAVLRVTQRGRVVSSLRGISLCTQWGSAMVLVAASEIARVRPDSIAARVLCSMAAILELHLSSQLLFFSKGRAWPTGKARINVCEHPGSDQAYSGALWFTFAVYCRSDLTAGRDFWYLDEHLCADTLNLGIVRRKEKTYIEHVAKLQVSEQVQSWSAMGQLAVDDIEEIQTALAKAFLFQFVRFPSKPEFGDLRSRDLVVEAVHCHSGQIIRVKGNRLVIELERIWDSNPYGFYAFYLGPLRLDEDGTPKTDEVTYIPTRILINLAEKSNQIWPDWVRRADYGIRFV